MYPFIRAIAAVLRGRRQPSAGLYDTVVTHHIAWPWDVDMFGELNNGRILTLYELGRWTMTAQVGMTKLITEHKLAFAVAGASVHYRRRIPLMSRYEMRTRLLGYDDKFFYVDQSMWMGDTACNQLLLRAAFTKNRKLLAPADALALGGFDVPHRDLPAWVHGWIDADATRTWPPVDADGSSALRGDADAA